MFKQFLVLLILFLSMERKSIAGNVSTLIHEENIISSLNLLNLGHPFNNILEYLEPRQAGDLASTNRQIYITVKPNTFEKIIPPTDQLIKGGDPVDFNYIECIKSLTYGRPLLNSILKSKLHQELAKAQYGIILLNNQYHYLTKDIRVPLETISNVLPVAENMITNAIHQHMKTQTYITADKNLTQKQIDHLFKEYLSIEEIINLPKCPDSKKYVVGIITEGTFPSIMKFTHSKIKAFFEDNPDRMYVILGIGTTIDLSVRLIPYACKKLAVVGDTVTVIRDGFLKGACGIYSVELYGLKNVIQINNEFMMECLSIDFLDLFPLQNVTGIGNNFLFNCNFEFLNLPELTNLHIVGHGFLMQNWHQFYQKNPELGKIPDNVKMAMKASLLKLLKV